MRSFLVQQYPLDPNIVSLCLSQEVAYLQDFEGLPEQSMLAD